MAIPMNINFDGAAASATTAKKLGEVVAGIIFLHKKDPAERTIHRLDGLAADLRNLNRSEFAEFVEGTRDGLQQLIQIAKSAGKM